MKNMNSHGFTLIEVLMSILILAVGVAAAAGMQSSAIRGNTSAKETEIAIQLAEEMIDRIRVNGNTTPEKYNGINTVALCGGVEPARGDCNQWKGRLESSTTGLQSAVGTVTVENNTPFAKVATITVTISWGSRSVRLKTLIETWLS